MPHSVADSSYICAAVTFVLMHTQCPLKLEQMTLPDNLVTTQTFVVQIEEKKTCGHIPFRAYSPISYE